ncbi:N-acetylmuramoyl-L-alanine amidase [Salidesulfovibrio onnuriiensis]|uniref:N-acetylmuramoyl-L-alanine amidase n=1 Tax=Salidesulfovibrio onnuriiensis TaxID=2583823 RepID=UPI00164FEDA1|nr:N-acetylmuramoyl-L-alanine amidase [Salidesulfovibrio onnuriiensis]
MNKTRKITLFSIGLLLCILFLGQPHAAQAASTSALFNKAYKDFHSLKDNRSRARYRSNWLAVEKQFSAIYRRDVDGPYAPKSLYYLGRTYEELGIHSGLKSDFRKSVDYYSRCASRFTKHGWADDCIYLRAEVRYKRLNEWTNARRDLATIIVKYPQSDMAPKARALLKKMGDYDKFVAEASGKAAPRKPAPTAKATPAPVISNGNGHTDPPNFQHLDNIRYTSSDEYTRVVLEMDGKTSFRYKMLQPAPEHNRPHRLYIDLNKTHLGNGVDRATNVSDGILKQIRSGQKDKQTTRVVLDFLTMQDYKVFPLQNPFRIVVDVYSPDASQAQEQAVASPKQTTRTKTNVTGKFKPSYKSKRLSGDLVEQLGLTIKTIMIDAGHGGKDPGARAYNIREKDVNLRFAKLLGEQLRQKGFNVIYTRTTDKFLALEERTALANVKKADMFISIHCNANRSKQINGLEIYTLNLAKTNAAVRVAARENAVDPRSISDLQFILADLAVNSKMKESRDLAKGLQTQTLREVRRKYRLKDMGVREAPFYVLMGATMPSVLVELGYLTNYTENKRLQSETYLTYLARGLVKGVMAYKAQIERYAMR